MFERAERRRRAGPPAGFSEKSDIGNQYIYPIPQKSDILDLNMNTIHKTYITHIYVTRFNPLFLNQNQKSYRILITSR